MKKEKSKAATFSIVDWSPGMYLVSMADGFKVSDVEKPFFQPLLTTKGNNLNAYLSRWIQRMKKPKAKSKVDSFETWLIDMKAAMLSLVENFPKECQHMSDIDWVSALRQHSVISNVLLSYRLFKSGKRGVK